MNRVQRELAGWLFRFLPHRCAVASLRKMARSRNVVFSSLHSLPVERFVSPLVQNHGRPSRAGRIIVAFETSPDDSSGFRSWFVHCYVSGEVTREYRTEGLMTDFRDYPVCSFFSRGRWIGWKRGDCTMQRSRGWCGSLWRYGGFLLQ